MSRRQLQMHGYNLLNKQITSIAKEVGYHATQWDVEGLLQIKVAYRPKKINRSHLTQIRVVETDHKVYEGRPP